MRKFLVHDPLQLDTPKGHHFTIIRHFCKGCRICVEFCPTQTLDLDDRLKVKVAYPDRCIGCRMCEYRCPDLAIYVRKAAKEDRTRHEGTTDAAGQSRTGEQMKHEDTKGTRVGAQATDGQGPGLTTKAQRTRGLADRSGEGHESTKGTRAQTEPEKTEKAAS